MHHFSAGRGWGALCQNPSHSRRDRLFLRQRSSEESPNAATQGKRTDHPRRAGDPDGQHDAAVLDPRLPRGRDRRVRWPASAGQALGRRPRGLPRQRGPDRPDRRVLPAPPGIALFRAQRGMRAALRLSWLEIRRGGQLRRSAQRAPGASIQAQYPHRRLSDDRAWRHRLGLYGSARKNAGAAQILLDPGARGAPPCQQGHRGMQLAAGPGRRHRHLACADPASPPHR